MISEEKLWTVIGILWNEAVRQLKIQSSTQCHHLAVRGGNYLCHFQAFRTLEIYFIFLNIYFLIIKMGVLFLYCYIVSKEKRGVTNQVQWHFFPFTPSLLNYHIKVTTARLLLVDHQLSRILVFNYFRTIPKCWQCWTWTCIWICFLNS